MSNALTNDWVVLSDRNTTTKPIVPMISFTRGEVQYLIDTFTEVLNDEEINDDLKMGVREAKALLIANLRSQAKAG